MSHLPYVLPVFPILQEAWVKVKGCKSAFFVAALLSLLIIFTLLFAEDATREYFSKEAYFALTVFSSLINFLLIAGVTYLGMRKAYGKSTSFHHLLYVFKPKMMLNVLGIYFFEIIN